MKFRRRHAVSELYATMLMVGATLSFGGLVTAAAVNQFSASTNGDFLAASAQQAAIGKQISFVYGTVVAASGGCTATYTGPDGGTYTEGKTYVLALYDYGSVSFTPNEVFDNGTLLAVGGYSTIPASGLASISLTLTSCAHPAGQNILLVDTTGVEISIGT